MTDLREQARSEVAALGEALEAHGVTLRPLTASDAQGAARPVRSAARCYDDAFWMIETLQAAAAIACARKGVEFLNR